MELSVFICTRDRPESLSETLRALECSGRGVVPFEVVVIDNGSGPGTRRTVLEWSRHLVIRYLVEPESAGYGKGPGLNRALALPALGRLIVVLDDDMSVDEHWMRGVISISDRWRDCDVFTGRSRIDLNVWKLPEWLEDPRIRGWILSVVDHGPKDSELREGGMICGNHFWFRSSVVRPDVRFESIWNPELGFCNTLFERGCRGMYGPEASVVHRIQDALLNPVSAVGRARKVGRTTARMRMIPYRERVNAARLMKRHPLIGRLFCAAQWIRWNLPSIVVPLMRESDRIRWNILVAQWTSYYFELLRLSWTREEYQWLGPKFSMASHAE